MDGSTHVSTRHRRSRTYTDVLRAAGRTDGCGGSAWRTARGRRLLTCRSGDPPSRRCQRIFAGNGGPVRGGVRRRGNVSTSWLITAASNSWFAIGPVVVLLLAGDHSPDGRWAILLLALAAQFTCDFAANAVRERLFHEMTIRELLREAAPIYVVDLALSPLGLAMAFAASAAQSQWPVLLIAPLFGILNLLSRERHQRLLQLVELSDAYQGTALLLGDVVEADDTYTGEHSKSVVRLALDVAQELGLDADRKRYVEFGALLHDVGKIAVPKEIINKPGKLDEQEWEIIKTHTIEGQKMLEKIG